MSSEGKRKEDAVRASDDDESETHEPEPPKKVAKPAESSDEMEEIFICNISKNRKVFVKNSKGRIWISIRQVRVKDGLTLPCKTGISLSLDQWNDLRNHEEDIDKALSDLS